MQNSLECRSHVLWFLVLNWMLFLPMCQHIWLIAAKNKNTKWKCVQHWIEINLQGSRTKCTSVKVLESVHGSFMVDQISRPFKAFLTEPTLMIFLHLVHVFDVFLQSIQIWRFLPAIGTSIVKRLSTVVFNMTLVRFEISKIMSANFTTNAIFISSHVRLHVLINCILCFKCFGTNFADFDMVWWVRVVLKVNYGWMFNPVVPNNFEFLPSDV